MAVFREDERCQGCDTIDRVIVAFYLIAVHLLTLIWKVVFSTAGNNSLCSYSGINGDRNGGIQPFLRRVFPSEFPEFFLADSKGDGDVARIVWSIDSSPGTKRLSNGTSIFRFRWKLRARWTELPTFLLLRQHFSLTNGTDLFNRAKHCPFERGGRVHPPFATYKRRNFRHGMFEDF